MKKFLMTLIGAMLVVSSSAAAQLVTSPVRLVDSSPNTAGLALNTYASKVTPPQKKGTVITSEPCSIKDGLFVYALGTTCPEVAVNPWMPRLPETMKDGKTHKLEKPTVPITYSGEQFAGRSYVVNRWSSSVNVLPANDLTIEGARLTCSDNCVLLTRDSRRTVIRDVVATGVGNEPYKAAVKLDGKASDVLVERVVATGFTSTKPSGYANADGVASERENLRITFRYVTATDNTDGCFDLKSSWTVLDHVRAERCRYGLRLWGRENTGTYIYVADNRNANIQIVAGSSSVLDVVEFGGATAPQKGDIVKDRTGEAFLEIKECRGRKPVLASNVRSSVILGLNCK